LEGKGGIRKREIKKLYREGKGVWVRYRGCVKGYGEEEGSIRRRERLPKNPKGDYSEGEKSANC